MTLEKSIFASTLNAHNHAHTPLETPNNAIPNTPTISKVIKDSPIRRHLLNRTISGQTIQSGSSTTGFSSRAWASTDSVDQSQFIDKRFGSHAVNPHAYRREHFISATFPKGSSNSRCKRNHHQYGRLNRSLKAHPSPESSLPSTPEKSTVSIHSSSSREILLDFPSMPKLTFCSPRSSAAKRSGKNRDGKEDSISLNRSLRTASSMPGLTEKSHSDSERHSTDSRPLKSCALFFLFRRKKKSSVDRSPSPDCSRSEGKSTHRTPSHPSSTSQSLSRSERLPSSSTNDRRPSSQFSLKTHHTPTSSRVPLTSLTPSSTRELISPISKTQSKSDKGHHYTSRSRSHHRGDRRRRSSTPVSRTQSEVQLRHEDLPPHPSLFKKAIEKSASNPNSIPYLRNSNNRLESSSRPRREVKVVTDLNNVGLVSASAQNFKESLVTYSIPNSGEPKESTTTHSAPNLGEQKESAATGSTPNLGEQKESAATGSTPNLGEQKSLQSTSKTDLEDDSHCQDTTSSSDRRRHSRSQSLPSFRGGRYQPDADTKVISDAEDFEYNPTDMKGPLHLSLCGCGFLGMYHLGVVACLSQRAPSFLERVEKVVGASAGALMAAVLVTSCDKIEESADQVHKLAREIRRKPLGALTPGYSFSRSLRTMLEELLPEEAHEMAKGKLHVSLTNADTRKNELISDFKSRDELIEALVASCYIPVYAGIKFPTIRGKKYMDGGLSDNLPRFDVGRTITVSPFDGRSDIGPKQGQESEKKAHFISLHNQDLQVAIDQIVTVNNIKKGAHAFFPPKPHVLQDYFEKGRYDASRFLIREGLYEIKVPQQPKTVLYESSV